jgi:hypothetical protein
MRRRNYAMEKAVPLLMTMGFTIHLVNLAHYLRDGHTAIREVILPGVDVVLGSWMAYCAVGLILGFKGFFERFAVHGWRVIVYWIVTFYVTASVPGHVLFLLRGDTRYFDVFPWWFSPIIMCVYVLFILYFTTLSQNRQGKMRSTDAG